MGYNISIRQLSQERANKMKRLTKRQFDNMVKYVRINAYKQWCGQIENLEKYNKKVRDMIKKTISHLEYLESEYGSLFSSFGEDGRKAAEIEHLKKLLERAENTKSGYKFDTDCAALGLKKFLLDNCYSY